MCISLKPFTFVLGTVVLAFAAVAAAQAASSTYDVAASFEQGWPTPSNPNGVWSYGYSSGFTSPVTLYNLTGQNGQNALNGTNTQFWNSAANNSGTPAAAFNNGPAFTGGSGSVDFLANQFVLSAGIGGPYSDLVFTAPANGTYSVVSSFRGDQTGVSTVIGVVVNGNVLFSSSVTAQGQTVPFSTTVSLRAGNTVVFSVGPGSATQTTGIATGLSATITGPAAVTTTGVQVLPQLAFGGGWYTALYFTNITNAPVFFNVSFLGDDGNPLLIPALGTSSTTVNLAPRGTALIEIPNIGPLTQGYVSVALPAGVTGYGVFRQSAPGASVQEAVVLLSATTATTSTLLFDDTNYVTGVAVVNLSPVSTTISVFARDGQGNTIGTSSIPLAANAKTAVVLRDLAGLAGVAGAVGSVDFTTSIGNVAALGLRFNGAAFTSIPTSAR